MNPNFQNKKILLRVGLNENQDLLVLYIKLTNSENDNNVLRNDLLYFVTIPFQRSFFLIFFYILRQNVIIRRRVIISLYYRPPEGGRLYDMKVVSGYAFLRTYYV